MPGPTCPLPARKVLDGGFLESRSRLLEVAAFLDRIDRAPDPQEARCEFRYQALRQALVILADADGGRSKALLLHFSDPTAEPRESAVGLKGAVGAWDGGIG